MTSVEAQPALATTKRKFHRLLDNLTASTSTTSLVSTLNESNHSNASLSQPDSPDNPHKRPRSSNLSAIRQRNISESQERIRLLKEQLTTPRREGTVRLVGGKQASVATTPRKEPNFQPFSQEQFLSRLKTFADVKKWTSKPDTITEVEWAKRGWRCDTWNTVACKGGCERRIAVKLRPKRKMADGTEIEMSEDLSENVDDALVKRYEEFITTAHSEDCLWKKRGCEDDIYHIAITSRTKISVELLSRYNALRSISADLPLLTNITYPGRLVQDILSRLPSTFFTSAGSEVRSDPPTSTTDVVAFVFALFGWTGISESRISLAVCSHCFQRIGLWLSSSSRLSEMSEKLNVPIESLRLNLLESHREHCPWKNAVVQANTADSPIAHMAAWETLEFILLGKQNTTSPQKSRHQGNIEGVDSSSEVTYPRGSFDDEDGLVTRDEEDESDSLQKKWKKLKAKLKRTASKKSLKSIKSMKSVKSTKSGAEQGRDD